MTFITTEQRDGPLVLSMPHSGTDIPEAIRSCFTATGHAVGDTDWWLEQLYDFAEELDATVVRTSISRYVIDVNRDPSGQSLYPGQATTELCPTTTFDGKPLYVPGQEPNADAIAQRRTRWFDPYHATLAEQLERIKARHGFALLYDCHSIRSVIPRLFDGELPVLNVGTNSGASCAPAMQQAVMDTLARHDQFSHIANGRFRGGWITRDHGDPANKVHALQMELAQRAYMQETPPWTFDAARADAIRPVLKAACTAMLDWGRKQWP